MEVCVDGWNEHRDDFASQPGFESPDRIMLEMDLRGDPSESVAPSCTFFLNVADDWPLAVTWQPSTGRFYGSSIGRIHFEHFPDSAIALVVSDDGSATVAEDE